MVKVIGGGKCVCTRFDYFLIKFFSDCMRVGVCGAGGIIGLGLAVLGERRHPAPSWMILSGLL